MPAATQRGSRRQGSCRPRPPWRTLPSNVSLRHPCEAAARWEPASPPCCTMLGPLLVAVHHGMATPCRGHARGHPNRGYPCCAFLSGWVTQQSKPGSVAHHRSSVGVNPGRLGFTPAPEVPPGTVRSCVVGVVRCRSQSLLVSPQSLSSYCLTLRPFYTSYGVLLCTRLAPWLGGLP